MAENVSILVVDDSHVVLEAVSQALIQDGFNVTTAVDGVDAINKIKTMAFDLILLDIDMPKMNGYQVCRLMKNDPVFQHIPIIMLTAKTSDSDKLWGLKAGADEYITKPFEYPVVKRAIEKLLRNGK